MGKNDLDFCGFGGRGGWMRWKQRDNNIFGGWVLLLTLLFFSRGRFWARFGKVGIIGLGWIIVDLSRYKLKRKNTRGVDVMIKVFIFSFPEYNTYILSIAAKVFIQKGVLQLRRQRH